MARAKIKVFEWWERQPKTGGVHTYTSEALARRKGERDRGVLIHVTRYRLAPLVDVPWTRNKSISSLEVLDVLDPKNGLLLGWCMGRVWRVGDNGPNCEDTPEAAKAACATHLRELGWRVTDAL